MSLLHGIVRQKLPDVSDTFPTPVLFLLQHETSESTEDFVHLQESVHNKKSHYGSVYHPFDLPARILALHSSAALRILPSDFTVCWRSVFRICSPILPCKFAMFGLEYVFILFTLPPIFRHLLSQFLTIIFTLCHSSVIIICFFLLIFNRQKINFKLLLVWSNPYRLSPFPHKTPTP